MFPQAGVDDKGRLKFARGVHRVPGSVLAGRSCSYQPRSINGWVEYTRCRCGKSNLNVLRSAKDKQLAQRKQFEAKVNGDAVEIDDNGRVLLPAATRKLLGITGKDQVWLDAFNGRVNLVTKNVYDERMRESDENRATDEAALDEMEGFR